jgi:hypothetical protein
MLRGAWFTPEDDGFLLKWEKNKYLGFQRAFHTLFSESVSKVKEKIIINNLYFNSSGPSHFLLVFACNLMDI